MSWHAGKNKWTSRKQTKRQTKTVREVLTHRVVPIIGPLTLFQVCSSWKFSSLLSSLFERMLYVPAGPLWVSKDLWHWHHSASPSYSLLLSEPLHYPSISFSDSLGSLMHCISSFLLSVSIPVLLCISLQTTLPLSQRSLTFTYPHTQTQAHTLSLFPFPLSYCSLAKCAVPLQTPTISSLSYTLCVPICSRTQMQNKMLLS